VRPRPARHGLFEERFDRGRDRADPADQPAPEKILTSNTVLVYPNTVEKLKDYRFTVSIRTLVACNYGDQREGFDILVRAGDSGDSWRLHYRADKKKATPVGVADLEVHCDDTVSFILSSSLAFSCAPLVTS